MQDLNRELGPRVQAHDLYVLLPLAIVIKILSLSLKIFGDAGKYPVNTTIILIKKKQKRCTPNVKCTAFFLEFAFTSTHLTLNLNIFLLSAHIQFSILSSKVSYFEHFFGCTTLL